MNNKKKKTPSAQRVHKHQSYSFLKLHLFKTTVLETHRVQNLFLKESQTQGKHFDDPASVCHIGPFIKTYRLDLTELLEQDVTKYGTFNAFFYRKLKEGARPIDSKDDPVSVLLFII